MTEQIQRPRLSTGLAAFGNSSRDISDGDFSNKCRAVSSLDTRIFVMSHSFQLIGHYNANHKAAWFGSTALAGRALWRFVGCRGRYFDGAPGRCLCPSRRRDSRGGCREHCGAKGAVTIDQSSQNAVINWQSFSIGQGRGRNLPAAQQQFGCTQSRSRAGIPRLYWGACRPTAKSSW